MLLDFHIRVLQRFVCCKSLRHISTGTPSSVTIQVLDYTLKH